MNYREFNTADFAADQYFIEWVLKPNPQNREFWTRWLKANPEKKEVVKEAREIVFQFAQDEDEILDWELDAIWQNISEARKAVGEGPTPGNYKVRRLQTGIIYKAAAVILIIITSGIFLYTTQFDTTPEHVAYDGQQKAEQPEELLILMNANSTYSTKYGEKRRLKLPDGSVVVLNANSKIEITSNWTSSEPREVKLQGEAFFNVTHTANDQKFLVKTDHGLMVEVIGTEFNVSDRGSKNQVVLSSGKVRLYAGEGTDARQVDMKPGELVEFREKTKELYKTEVSTELYTSWKDNRLIFHNTSLGEIARLLKENYGYPVVFKDQALADLEITASLEGVTLESILMTLSETLEIEIIWKKGQITIEQNSTNQ